jgi:hypothetical protein
MEAGRWKREKIEKHDLENVKSKIEKQLFEIFHDIRLYDFLQLPTLNFE